MRLPLLKTAPVIDGEVKDDEWAGAARMERFGWGGLLSPQEASFWVGSDGKELFIAVVSETPPNGKILARVPPMAEDGDARSWLDDSIEMVLDPLRADATGRRRLYHANLNSRGAINDTAYLPNGTGEAWRGHWRLAGKVIGDRWHFEAALPLKDMGVAAADLQQPFGVRICRNWQQHAAGPPQTEWGAFAGAFLKPETMPLVTWDARAPVVQALQLHDPGKLSFHARVAIRNPHADPMEVKVAVQCVPKSSAPSKLDRTVKIASNSMEIVDFTGSATAGEEVYGAIQVASSDGNAVYYLRDFNWKLARPAPLWATDEQAAKKVEVNFAYFPYHDTIKAMVGFNGLEEKDKVSAVGLRVRAKGETKAVAATRMPAPKKYSSEMEWKIPPLKEGSYEFVAELEGVAGGIPLGRGIKVEPHIVEFVRHVMPWEHNPLGKSDAVIEPFEPIRVEGQKVSTVLRTHTLNNLGLWEQVESLGKPLLKAPMRLEIKAGGKIFPAEAKKLKFTHQKPSAVVAESDWQSGGVTGATRSEWDYDGLMKWTLEVQPAQEPVEAMTLIIPLDDRLMPLFHACTDGLRFNYAGLAPAGRGRVWDGGKAARNSIIGSYVPYIWIGAEERGLALFGENDRGWTRDPKVPCQELVRNGDTLELRLNLIARSPEGDVPSSPGSEKGADPATGGTGAAAPSGRTGSRRIVIGFQATPTKPMPDGWRRWTMGCGPREDDLNFAFLGSCWYWGTLGPCSEIYPRNEDFRLYEKFAETRRTGEVDKKFIEEWLAGYPKMDEGTMQAYPPHINAGFHIMKVHKPLRVLIYTNARGVRLDTPEGQTFLDEWHRDAFPTRKWGLGGSVAYDLDPVESFRDYALWYYQKMFDTFVEDIYWDDIFLQSNFDTVGTDAYAMPDGAIQPASGLFNMRALIRRTAVFQHERKKRGFNMAHMTNTAIAPILSFCGTLYTWEDRAGDADFQDRYSRDYIRAESIGRQHGAVPFSLTLINGAPTDPKNQWVLRTNAGVALTHEIKPGSGYLYPAYWSNFTRLLEFGYGKPGTRVWNYWDADYPARIEGSETSSLVVNKPGRAIIIVCDYGNGGDLKLKLDPSLGLGAKFTATDLETNQPLTIGADGKIQFTLKKHDFKLVLAQTEGESHAKP